MHCPECSAVAQLEHHNAKALATDYYCSNGHTWRVRELPLEIPDPPKCELVEPDWRRIPGYRNVTRTEWENAKWQRMNGIEIKFDPKTGRLLGLDGLKRVFGSYISDSLVESIAEDQMRTANMQIRFPAHTVNTMNIDDLEHDPVRRSMLVAFRDRRIDWLTHPMAHRDSLHEKDMWATEGLVRRYRRKALLEPGFDCPQYCGYCTRMDSVGTDTPQITKVKFKKPLTERLREAAEELRIKAPQVRDLTFSGGDPVYYPIELLEKAIDQVLEEMPQIRDIRFGTKAPNNSPYEVLQSNVLKGWRRIIEKARERNESFG